MSVNKITNAVQTYDNKSTTKMKSDQNQAVEKAKQNNTENESAAIYDKSEQPVEKERIYQKDTVTIDRLMAEAEKRSQSLRNLVEKMMLKQGQTFHESTDVNALLREGKLEVDPETQAQAQKDIAEDGYWGIEQTSDRMVSFAKALAGGDSSKAEDMIAAVKKGFEAATKAWGGELPEISKNTLEATLSKLEAWRDGGQSDSNMDKRVERTFQNQATIGKLAE